MSEHIGDEHTNASTSTSDYEHLPRKIRDVLVRIERVAAEHLALLSSPNVSV